ncbi:MAG: LLM class F420-dependent oxidoreductase [Pseudomonadota bacterium]
MPRCGVVIFVTDLSMQPAELAIAVEERGLDSLFVTEHTHIPTNSKSPFLPGGEVPEHYRRTYDPFVALGAAAAVTKRIALGTGICLVSQRDPITLAKEVATLDRMSNGRFIFGIGAGWNKPEVENHGTPFDQRWAILRERILAMKVIWSEEHPEFHGDHVNFDPMLSYPKPVQAGGPPIWIGANSKYVAERIAEYADGWLPIGGRDGGADIEAVAAACEARGRSIDDIVMALFFPPMDVGECRAKVDEGYSEFIFALPSAPADEVLVELDKIAKISDELRA